MSLLNFLDYLRIKLLIFVFPGIQFFLEPSIIQKLFSHIVVCALYLCIYYLLLSDKETVIVLDFLFLFVKIPL